jgi:hypothetical protein
MCNWTSRHVDGGGGITGMWVVSFTLRLLYIKGRGHTCVYWIGLWALWGIANSSGNRTRIPRMTAWMTNHGWQYRTILHVSKSLSNKPKCRTETEESWWIAGGGGVEVRGYEYWGTVILRSHVGLAAVFRDFELLFCRFLINDTLFGCSSSELC